MRRRPTPVPYAPRHHRDWLSQQQTLSHLPRRPLWLCRACEVDWPCGQARLTLLREHGGDLV